MVSFDPNTKGFLYQLNYSNRPMDPETGTRRGSSGGMVNQSYFIVEQVVSHEPMVVLPKPLVGFRVRSLNPHNYRVALALKPSEHTIVGVLLDDAKFMDIKTDLGGFVQGVYVFSDSENLKEQIASLAISVKAEHALDYIEKLYKEVRKKSGLVLPE